MTASLPLEDVDEGVLCARRKKLIYLSIWLQSNMFGWGANIILDNDET